MWSPPEAPSWVGWCCSSWFFLGKVRIHFLHGNKSFSLHSITNSRTLNFILFITMILNISSGVTSVGRSTCVFFFPVGTEAILPPGGRRRKQWRGDGVTERMLVPPSVEIRDVDVDGYHCLGDHPLQDAGVFATGGDQMTVVVQEGNVGHVTAVATVLVARSL